MTYNIIHTFNIDLNNFTINYSIFLFYIYKFKKIECILYGFNTSNLCIKNNNLII